MRFNIYKSKNSKNFGILPDKLLFDRSRTLIPLNDSKDEGMTPWKKFLLMASNSSLTQLPRVVGIVPNIMFSEMSNCSRFFKFPTSMGRTPVNWLAIKSRVIKENDIAITSEAMVPLRLLILRDNLSKFWH